MNSKSIASSLLLHILLSGAFVVFFSLNPATGLKKQPEVLDLGYQTFDEPPPPQQPEEKRVVRSPQPASPIVDHAPKTDLSPKEIQDEKGDVVGTQKAVAVNQVQSQSEGLAASTPYYRIKPKYPRAALASGTEGWVLMEIDIKVSGEVDNVRVVGGEQRSLFESEARRAVSQWKYKPFLDNNGQPVVKQKHQVRVDFKLQDDAVL
jgi:protein TonB